MGGRTPGAPPLDPPLIKSKPCQAHLSMCLWQKGFLVSFYFILQPALGSLHKLKIKDTQYITNPFEFSLS